MLYYSIGNEPMSVGILYDIIRSMRLQHEIDLGRPDNTLSAGFPERHDLFVRRNKVIIALFPPRTGNH